MTPINEVARAVIALPPDSTLYGRVCYLAVAFDASADHVTPTRLKRSSSKRIEYLAGYELIGYVLCGDRAQRTVDGSLLVNGNVVTAESYLALWRSAIASPLSPAEFKVLHGLSLVAIINAPVDLIPRYRATWTCSPFRDFSSTKYAKNVEVTEGQLKLRLDLSETNAARDAFYLSEMIAGALRDEDDRWSATILLEGHLQSTSQPELFGATESGALV